MLYGNVIGLQYIYTQILDAKALAQAADILCRQWPALSARYDAKFGKLIRAETSKNKPIRLEVQSHQGSIQSALTSPKRPSYINEPRRKDILRGQANLASFTLTQFTDGSVLGVAISHLITDAAGFHKIIAHLGDIYSAVKSSNAIPPWPFITHLDSFQFGTDRSKSDILNTLKKRRLPKPISLKGIGGALIKSMIVRAMDKSLRHNAPIRIQFSATDIARLKQTVLRESGEPWISTNIALCAHFTWLIARLDYKDAPLKPHMQIGQLLDLRGRYFDNPHNEQAKFIGNAILIHIENAHFPNGLQNISRADLARYFKERQSGTNYADVKDKLDLLADCLRLGYTNPELDFKNPIISLNNQSKMAVYTSNFDTQMPVRIIPQDVGDNIMFFPAPDGGVEIYIRDIINPQGQQRLLTPDWQSLIFDF